MKGKVAVKRNEGENFTVKVRYDDNVGRGFINSVLSACCRKRKLCANVISGQEFVITQKFRNGIDLFFALNDIMSESAKSGREFKCVYVDDNVTFGKCGYYETAKGMLLGSKFMSIRRQEDMVGKFFSE